MSSSSRRRGAVGFVGAGNAAHALAAAGARAGVPIAGFASRTRRSAAAAARTVGGGARAFGSLAELASDSELIVVAVPDRAIGDAARDLAPHLRRGAVVAHLSGALGSRALAPCRRRGARVASFHPLQTFPGRGRGDAARVRGTFVAIEGDAAAVAALRRFARRLGMIPFALGAADRALYHASAVLASNAVVALFDLAAARLARSARLSPAAAARALLPLLEGTVASLRADGLPRALSGPVARGDESTVARHLAALRRDREADAIYRALGARAVGVARRKGTLSAAAARRLLRALSRPTSLRASRRLDP